MKVTVSILRLFIILAASIQCPLVCAQIPSNVHRILFLGNSITYAGSYITDIEAYCKTHYPAQQIEFINMGLPSETVSGLSEDGHAGGQFPRPDLHERLEKVLALTKPDLVFACYGMNDGIYLPFDKERFRKFKDGINWLHDEVVKRDARIVHVTPPIYDEMKGKNTGYAAVLDNYSDWLLSQVSAAKWEVIDIHYPMKKYLEAHRKVDEAFSLDGFALAADGVHPGETGHWIMARGILSYICKTNVASTTDINAALKTFPKGEQVLKLVSQRQTMMKDAWLSTAGHKRPYMKTGMPLDSAQIKSAEIEEQIRVLMR